MKYLSSLVQQYITIHDSPDNIANNLTCKICEIEDVVTRNIPELVVIGKVTDASKHPEADKLMVCQLDCGSHGVFQICTGGENVDVGMYVPVALPGCHLPVINLSIEPRKMRWLDSNGMICSKTELGINEDAEHHWIWDMTKDFDDLSDADIGLSLGKKYPWLESWILDVENKTITHRPDLTWHFGIATELYAMYDDAMIGMQNISTKYKEFASTDIIEHLGSLPSITRKIISETDGLRSYVLLDIDGLSLKSSTLYTRLQLLDLWHAPKNNWVDFSNLFMYIAGQPVHFFDANKVQGDIIVRQAKDGEKFVDIHNTEHILTAQDIVIADADKILALAGIIGGAHSAVSDSTTHILVEIANFDPVMVRKTGTRLGLRTDAELRFEKNINPAFSLYAVLFFMEQLKQYAKDLGKHTIVGGHYYIAPSSQAYLHAKAIEVSLPTMENLLWSSVDVTQAMKQYLTRLGFVMKKNIVQVPVWRWPSDMNIAADVYEEVARLVGYDNIVPTVLSHTGSSVSYPGDVWLLRTIEDVMRHVAHADQVESYPWANEKMLELFGVDTNNLYSITNALDPALHYLRDDMVYNLLQTLAKNTRFFDTIRMYDIGKIWHKQRQTDGGTFASEFVGEHNALGYIVYKNETTVWSDDSMFDCKGILQDILHTVWLSISYTLEHTHKDQYHPTKQAYIIYQGTKIGFIGAIHPLVLSNLKIPERASVCYLTLDLHTLLSLLPVEKVYRTTFETLQDQIVYRDLSFVLDSSVPFGLVTDAIRPVAGVEDVQVFDLYAGEKLGADKKSLAVSIKIKGDGTLTTEQINAVMDNAIAAAGGVGARLRDV